MVISLRHGCISPESTGHTASLMVLRI